MFQKKIIDKYIGQIEQETLDTAFFAFRGIFADSEKQANIRGGDYHIVPEHIRNIPIPAIPREEQLPLAEKAEKMLSLNAQVQKKAAKFVARLRDNLGAAKITGALQEFYALTFGDFVKELGKQKIKLSLKAQDEWEEYFGEYKAEILALRADIAATEREIDAAGDALYGLDAAEIAAVEEK